MNRREQERLYEETMARQKRERARGRSKPLAGLTPADGRARRDEGMETVAHAGPPDWDAYAREWCEDYLRSHATLFAFDLWGEGLVEPASPRKLGNVIKDLRVDGWIERTGETRPSPSSNNSPVYVWRSLAHGKPADWRPE